MNAFKSEAEITRTIMNSRSFLAGLENPGNLIWERQEVEDLFGIPDLVVAFKKETSQGEQVLRTFAFEMKRFDWKRALWQAFRYSSFAHHSCVVLDSCYVHRALSSLDKFKRSNIGLISVSTDGAIQWHYRPSPSQPYCDYLQQRLEDWISRDLTRQ